MVELEVGMKLDKDLIFYHDLLINHDLSLDFFCVTHDIYYTKSKLDGLTEKQMKDACIRLRICNELNKENKPNEQTLKEEQRLISDGYHKVFDTLKFDFHYSNPLMKSKIQLQDIKDIGLLIYYDNPDYYQYPLEEQRKLLLQELNSYGFNFNESDLGLDKLRTLYYGKEMYSINQNS